ncbi:unnamed protein product, partial [marine sediment metagenome]
HHEKIEGYQSKLQQFTSKLLSLDQTQVLYEIDSRKDHIMTNLKTALNNADMFVKECYKPEEYSRSDFRICTLPATRHIC